MHKFRTNFTPHCPGFTPQISPDSHTPNPARLSACLSAPDQKNDYSFLYALFYTDLIELLIMSKIFMVQADFHELWHNVYEVSKRGNFTCIARHLPRNYTTVSGEQGRDNMLYCSWQYITFNKEVVRFRRKETYFKVNKNRASLMYPLKILISSCIERVFKELQAKNFFFLFMYLPLCKCTSLKTFLTVCGGLTLKNSRLRILLSTLL